MAAHRVANHRVQFFDCVGLRGNGMSQSGSDIASVHLVFLDFKNDFAHGGNGIQSCRIAQVTSLGFVGLYRRNIPGKPPPIFAIIFWNLPIFFIICCIWANLLSMVLSSVTETPLPLAIR